MSDGQQRWEPLFRPVPIAPGPADQPKGRSPRAFLSYAWESSSHTNWVINLAERLQGKSGIEIILDQWYLVPGSDRLHFMEQGIESSDFVIVVCTPTYAERANSRDGGVGYESMVITSALASRFQNRQFIPILRNGEWNSSVPVYLRSMQGVDLRNDPYSETQYEQLVRAVHNEWVQPPPLGPKPAFSIRASMPATTGALAESPKQPIRDKQPNYVAWGDSDPGPCIDVIVMNSSEVIKAGGTVGLNGLEGVAQIEAGWNGRAGRDTAGRSLRVAQRAGTLATVSVDPRSCGL